MACRHTVVLSDIHLSEAEPGEGLWMRYRQRAYSPDAEIAAMLTSLRADVGKEPLVLVLDGDVFDFDAPRVIDKQSVYHDQPRDAVHAVPAVRAILDDHPVFVDAVAQIVADDKRVVFVAGNHDVQLALPEVREAIAERIAERAAGLTGQPAEDLRSRVAFRAWLHRTEDGIVIEHGSQYDPFCCHRYPMKPHGDRPREIQPTMGSLVARLLAARMGYFNPHVDSSCMLSPTGYLLHWARYYLFSRRSLAIAWMTGAIRTLWELVRRRHVDKSHARRRADIRAAARETGIAPRAIAAHARLFAKPAEDRMGQVIMNLRLDLLAVAALALVLTAAWIILAPVTHLAGAAVPAALVVLYEILVPRHSVEKTWARVRRSARRVARIHHARAVVFGHTHHAEGSWHGGVFYGNTGSWSAAFRDVACTQPLYEERPLVWLRSDERGVLSGGLAGWKDGRFVWR